MRKSIHGFPLFPYMAMGLRLAALWAAGAPLINMVQKKVHRTILTEFNNKKKSSRAVPLAYVICIR